MPVSFTLLTVTPADWIGIGALMVAPALAFMGIVYRAGQLTAAVRELRGQIEDNGQRITAVENWIRNRADGTPRGRR
jgi:hypothetical protein